MLQAPPELDLGTSVGVARSRITHCRIISSKRRCTASEGHVVGPGLRTLLRHVVGPFLTELGPCPTRRAAIRPVPLTGGCCL